MSVAIGPQIVASLFLNFFLLMCVLAYSLCLASLSLVCDERCCHYLSVVYIEISLCPFFVLA